MSDDPLEWAPISPSRIKRSELRELLSFWAAHCEGATLPSVSRIPPDELIPYLGHLIFAEIEEHTDRIRYRQVGEELVRIYGKNLDGVYIDDMPRLFRTYALPAYRAVLRRRQAVYGEIRFLRNLRFVTYERLMLPLRADEGDRVAEVIVGIYPRIGPRSAP
ncbi:MAG: PAS domain-containing protein [Alphaproteobacteria bacterium]|nr:PAS domain-containing protein [Alphaproteobacteria bacterium]